MPKEMLRTYFGRAVGRRIPITLGAERSRSRGYVVEIVGLEGNRLHGAVRLAVPGQADGRTRDVRVGEGAIEIADWMSRDQAVACLAVDADFEHWDRHRGRIRNGYSLAILEAVDRDREAAPVPDADTELPAGAYGSRGSPWERGKVPVFPMRGLSENSELLLRLDPALEERTGPINLDALCARFPAEADAWLFRASRTEDPHERLRFLDAAMRLGWSWADPSWFVGLPYFRAFRDGRSQFLMAARLHAVTLLEVDRPEDAFDAARELLRYDGAQPDSLMPMAAAAATTASTAALAFVDRVAAEHPPGAAAPWLWMKPLLALARGEDESVAAALLREALAANALVPKALAEPHFDNLEAVIHGHGPGMGEARFIAAYQRGAWEAVGDLPDILTKAAGKR